MQRELKILRKQILVTKKMLNDCGTSLCRARQDILDGDANDTLSGVERDALFSSVKVITYLSILSTTLSFFCSHSYCFFFVFLEPYNREEKPDGYP